MLSIREVIINLSDKDYVCIYDSLSKNKADKFILLFSGYRNNNTSDEELIKSLGVTKNAFYVLRSRLYEKIQEYLSDSLSSGPITEVLKKLSMIPVLLYDTDRSTASAILTKMEADMKEHDLVHELSQVYSALKTLYINTDKFYEYSQSYNKQVAYSLALGKAQDILSDFVIKLSQYDLSRSNESLEILPLLKSEILNVSKLYSSKNLKIFENIILVSFALFVPLPECTKNDEPIEDILYESEKIVESLSKFARYKYYGTIINYLFFEYYHSLKIRKKEDQYFDKVNSSLPSLLYFEHTCYCSRFLESKVERYIISGEEESLYEENKTIFAGYQPDKNNIAGYINYMKYIAVSAYYKDEYKLTSSILNDLINNVSFKEYHHSEIEIKLLLTTSLCMQNRYELAFNALRSIERKIKETKKHSYLNAQAFIKMLKYQLGSPVKNIEQKMKEQRDLFLRLNNGPEKMLSVLKVDDIFIKKLSKSVK